MLTGSDETRLSSVHAEHLALRLTRGGLLQIGSVLFFLRLFLSQHLGLGVCKCGRHGGRGKLWLS